MDIQEEDELARYQARNSIALTELCSQSKTIQELSHFHAVWRTDRIAPLLKPQLTA